MPTPSKLSGCPLSYSGNLGVNGESYRGLCKLETPGLAKVLKQEQELKKAVCAGALDGTPSSHPTPQTSIRHPFVDAKDHALL
jgi:hypothetical protein